jgi:hypothetical protein
MRRGAGVMLGGDDTGTIPDRIPERIYCARCRVPGCRGFGLVTLLAADLGHDFQPMTPCGDPIRCGDKVAHPPECEA